MGPPGRSQQLCRGGERDSKSLTMVARMMWLFAVAQVGRELHGVGINKDRDVGFIFEYPEGTPWEQRQAREREIIEAEDSMRDPTGRGRGALWVESIHYWEQVQRPRWEDQVGLATVNANVSFWDTRMWKAFQREAQTRVISFDQGAMGGKSRNRTSLGTNVRALMSLDEVRLPEECSSTRAWRSRLYLGTRVSAGLGCGNEFLAHGCTVSSSLARYVGRAMEAACGQQSCTV